MIGTVGQWVLLTAPAAFVQDLAPTCRRLVHVFGIFAQQNFTSSAGNPVLRFKHQGVRCSFNINQKGDIMSEERHNVANSGVVF